jgi:predicted deacylase
LIQIKAVLPSGGLNVSNVKRLGHMERYAFDSGRPGPSLLVTGAVHGNEVCGPKAIRQVMLELAGGALALTRGKLVAVPVVNRLAYEQNVRFVDENLNRTFRKHKDPQNNEQRVANEITPLIDECDYLVDLHSLHTPGGRPFIFIDNDIPAHEAFVRAMGLNYILAGWNKLYAEAGLDQPASTDYAESRGKIAACVECGGHEDAASVDIARECILKALRHLKMISGQAAPPKPATVIEFSNVVFKKGEGHLSRDWKHLDPVIRGDIVAEYEDGERVIADQSGYILLPFSDAKLGGEWCYLGQIKPATGAEAAPSGGEVSGSAGSP